MSVVRFPSDVLSQFAANVELITTATTRTGSFRRSLYRLLPEQESDPALDGMYFLALQIIVDRDPHWGTGENIQRGTLTVQTSYARGGGDAGGQDRQTVMRNAADDCQLVGDVCENPENYNAAASGISTVRCRGSFKVRDLDRAEVWETTFDVTWRTALSTEPVFAASSGGGVSIHGLTGEFASTSVTGADEDVVTLGPAIPAALPIDWDNYDFATVKIQILGFAKATAGGATIRARLGGTLLAADGTVVASMAVSGTSYALTSGVGSAFAKPSWTSQIQFTIEGDTAAATTYAMGLEVAVLDGAS